ncbi:MAG TPA: polysaccharide deacetylase family protein [Nitrospiraceae bacterium]|jgi:peptidoglycan/xylan/chitin deacetylase (PgdA/CDA1 family)|nr:polysaccharide deacetylase family protein [Nitrospiraceae bacterium]
MPGNSGPCVGLAAGLTALLGFVWMIAPGQAHVIKSGPPACKAAALTFDLCPVRGGTGYDAELINYLVSNRIPATFFLSGKWIAKHETEVQALLNVPFFEIGTHGHVHAHLPMQNEEEQRREILGPVTLLRTKYGRNASLFRPPYGEFNELTVDVVRSLGLRLILWSVESGDPDPQLTRAQILARLTARIKPGSVIVFHANGKGRHTRAVIEDLAQVLLPDRGLTPVTVSELLACVNHAPQPHR